jgi:hypothetical protein
VAYSDRGSAYRVSLILKRLSRLERRETKINRSLKQTKVWRWNNNNIAIYFQEKSKLGGGGGDVDRDSNLNPNQHSVIVHAMDDQGIDMTLVRKY